MALRNTPQVPQKIWSTVLLIMLVIVPAVLYIQLTIEGASEKELQAIAKLSGNSNKVPPTYNKPPTEKEVVIKEVEVEVVKEVEVEVTKEVVVKEDIVDDKIVDCLAGRGQKQCWRELKRKAWLAGLDKLEKLPEDKLAKYREPNNNWESFDLITPTHECDLNHFSREGMSGDGGKWICGPLTTNDNCVIFSLGSNNQFDFEQSMKKYTGGRCTIHTFDCTGNWSDPSTNFHPWCISGRDYTDPTTGYIFKRLSTIFNELGLKEINYLKMDIEGFEWSVFEDILKPENKFAYPRQISFELHVSFLRYIQNKEDFKGTTNWAYPMFKLLRLIDSAGYRFAASEVNTLCRSCAEFVVVREDVM